MRGNLLLLNLYGCAAIPQSVVRIIRGILDDMVCIQSVRRGQPMTTPKLSWLKECLEKLLKQWPYCEMGVIETALKELAAIESELAKEPRP